MRPSICASIQHTEVRHVPASDSLRCHPQHTQPLPVLAVHTVTMKVGNINNVLVLDTQMHSRLDGVEPANRISSCRACASCAPCLRVNNYNAVHSGAHTHKSSERFDSSHNLLAGGCASTLPKFSLGFPTEKSEAHLAFDNSFPQR